MGLGITRKLFEKELRPGIRLEKKGREREVHRHKGGSQISLKQTPINYERNILRIRFLRKHTSTKENSSGRVLELVWIGL